MCGITGIFACDRSHNERFMVDQVEAMADTLISRGPDEGDVWSDADAGLYLAHRRLSVIDLSMAGHQPMVSSSGRYVIIYNGEVYNSDELSDEIQKSGITLRGHSDTEIILESCAKWGVTRAINMFTGMFAFALWDKREKTLYLVRDRLGIKPLYWGRFGGLFLFGSELKALRAHSGWRPQINRNALASFMRHSYIPAPMTIFNGIFKLQPGCVLKLKVGEEPRIDSYWSLSNVVKQEKDSEVNLSDSEATKALDELLRDAVSSRMVADVPLGAFLSGGIDSSTVVALMQAQSPRPVHTFSIGFHETGFNEAHHAAAVAKYLGTDHTELYVTAEEAQEVIPRLSEIYDEPFADSSQIPTYLVSALTRQHVTVALSGDGGDECFAGYNRYFLAERIRRLQRHTPKAFRSAVASVICSVSPEYLDRLSSIIPVSVRPPQFGDRLHKLAGVLLEEEDDFYRRLISHWNNPESLVLNSVEPKGIVWDTKIRGLIPDFSERMRYFDLLTYLPDDILTKVDRASMAVSLEARVPLLDHRVVEFLWRLPKHFKIRDGQGKWLLRQVLYKYVPKEMVERPKMGFGVPIDKWLRGPLRDWAENLLDENRIRQEGYLNHSVVREKWQEHLSGNRNWQYHLWNVLMFQAWHEHWMA